MSNLSVGMILCTKNSQALSNAIIVAIEGDTVTVLSDFGNLMNKPKSDIFLQYEPAHYYQEYIQFGFPFPTLAERIDQQIELLTKAKEQLNLE